MLCCLNCVTICWSGCWRHFTTVLAHPIHPCDEVGVLEVEGQVIAIAADVGLHGTLHQAHDILQGVHAVGVVLHLFWRHPLVQAQVVSGLEAIVYRRVELAHQSLHQGRLGLLRLGVGAMVL